MSLLCETSRSKEMSALMELLREICHRNQSSAIGSLFHSVERSQKLSPRLFQKEQCVLEDPDLFDQMQGRQSRSRER